MTTNHYKLKLFRKKLMNKIRNFKKELILI